MNKMIHHWHDTDILQHSHLKYLNKQVKKKMNQQLKKEKCCHSHSVAYYSNKHLKKRAYFSGSDFPEHLKA